MVRPPSPTNKSIKFLCSYGGKIVPRYPDGKLRYLGGHTRVLAVHRSVSFSELMVKMGELCGASSSVTLRCQLPTEDLDALVTVKSDEDLVNLIEEYDRIESLKIRAFLSTYRPPAKSPSPPATEYAASSPSPKSLSPSSSFSAAGSSPRYAPLPPSPRANRKSPGGAPGGVRVAQSHYGCHHCHRSSSHVYLIHNGNHWQ